MFRPVRTRESSQARAEAKAARARMDSEVARAEADQVIIHMKLRLVNNN